MAAENGVSNDLTEVKSGLPPSPSFEDVLDKLGMPGRFQIIQLTLGLTSSLILAFMPMAFVFLGHEPSHICNKVNETKLLSKYGVIGNSTETTAAIEYGSCDIAISTNQTGRVTTMDCPDGRNFSKAKHTTWLSEWDLVCEDKGVAELSFTFYNAGLVVGGLFWSAIADRFGRKPVLIFCSLMCVFWEAVILFAPNISLINGVRFISGIFRQGVCEVYFVLGLEHLTVKYREVYGVIAMLKWVFDLLFVGLIAYLFQDYDWKYFQGSVAVSGLFVVLYPLFLDESPRWLTSKNRFDEALSILKKACRQNGKDFEEVKTLYNKYVTSTQQLIIGENLNQALEPLNKSSDVADLDYSTEIKDKKTEQGSLLTLFSHRDLAIITLSMWFIWFAHNMTYYGLFMMSSTLVGNRFLNYGLVAVVEIPSCLLILVMMKKIKRLRVINIFLSLTACSLLVYFLLKTFGEDSPGVYAANTIFFVFGKLCISASYFVLVIITPEIYPTTLRATASASCNSFSRIGAMLVPFLRPLITVVKWGPGVIFTVICFVALILMVFLPETKDKELVENIASFKMSLSRKRQKQTTA